MSTNSDEGSYDVLIVGAGLSGVNCAYRLQTQCPGIKYAVLERRHELGGTWSLFKYPGIRSDSDLYTYGFGFRIWEKSNPIADGESIIEYIKSTTEMYGIDKNLQFNTEVVSVDWRSDIQHHNVKCLVNGKPKTLTTKFIFFASGYYDYKQPRHAEIPGLADFKGTTIHPQFWPEDYDYSGKRIIVIGSGATAITLVPNLAKKAAQVTMLQRSPSYVLSADVKQPVDEFIRKWFPSRWSHSLIRLRWILFSFFFYHFCRYFPEKAKKGLIEETAKHLPAHVPSDPHFKPLYNPWDQRLCACPDGDFFQSLHNRTCDVKTATIKTVVEDGIVLDSGEKIDADLIVTATGLKLQLLGGASILVDGEPITLNDKFLWRGAMIQDVPNAAFVFGYSNLSYTLSADVTAQLMARVINAIKARGATSAVPQLQDPQKLIRAPFIDLKSGYVEDVPTMFPKTATVAPWAPRNSYFSDIWFSKAGSLDQGLKFLTVKI